MRRLDPIHGFFAALCLLVAAAPGLLAQEPVVLSADKRLPLEEISAWLDDPGGELSLQDVSQGEVAERFQTTPRTESTLDPDTGLWRRFRVVRHTAGHPGQPTNIGMLVINRGWFRELCVYWPRAGGIYSRQCTDIRSPFDSRPIAHTDFVFPIPRDLADDRPAFVYGETATPQSMRGELVSWSVFWQASQRDLLVKGLFFGALLAMVLYNAFLFLSIRDDVYFYYSTHIGFFGLAFFGFDHLSAQYLWPNQPWLWPSSLAFLGIAFVGGSLYMRSFLQTRRRLPLANKGLLAAALLAAVGASITFIDHNIANTLIGVASILFAVTALTASIVRLRAGFRAARFLLAAQATFLTALPMTALSAMNVIPWFPSQLDIVRFVFASGALLLSFGLADRLRQLTAEREELIPALRTRTADLERFNYSVSHDLKTPLVTIQNYIGWIERDALTGNAESLETDLTHVRGAVRQMQRVLDSLHEYSRSDHLTTTRQGSFTDLVNAAVEEYADDLAEHGATLDIEDGVPELLGDWPRLRQLVINLLDNALRYSSEEPKIVFGARKEGDEGVFWCQDNGPGIAPRYHEKIFGLFEKLDADSETLGAGLAVAKRIVEAHGGRMWIESDGAGNGSTFYWTLPLAPETSS